MKPTPKDWPRITSGLYCRDAATMIDWLCAAFGFTVRIRIDGDDGRVVHSELEYGDGLIMVSEEQSGPTRRFDTELLSPATAHCNTQNVMVYVDDVDGHHARAKAAGARIQSEPKDVDYGAEHWTDRSYGAFDPEGHLWWFAERIRG